MPVLMEVISGVRMNKILEHDTVLVVSPINLPFKEICYLKFVEFSSKTTLVDNRAISEYGKSFMFKS